MLTCGAILASGSIMAQSQTETPSETYYKENIAAKSSPTLRAGDDDLDPGGSTTGPGGWVGAPLGDGVIPISVAAITYLVSLAYSRRGKK